MDPRLAVLKIFMIFWVYYSKFVLFFPDCPKFSLIQQWSIVPENGVMIQQKVRRKKIPVLMVIFSTFSQKWRIKKVHIYRTRCGQSLAKSKCESLHAVQYKWQPGSVLIFFSYYIKND